MPPTRVVGGPVLTTSGSGRPPSGDTASRPAGDRSGNPLAGAGARHRVALRRSVPPCRAPGLWEAGGAIAARLARERVRPSPSWRRPGSGRDSGRRPVRRRRGGRRPEVGRRGTVPAVLRGAPGPPRGRRPPRPTPPRAAPASGRSARPRPPGSAQDGGASAAHRPPSWADATSAGRPSSVAASRSAARATRSLPPGTTRARRSLRSLSRQCPPPASSRSPYAAGGGPRIGRPADWRGGTGRTCADACGRWRWRERRAPGLLVYALRRLRPVPPTRVWPRTRSRSDEAPFAPRSRPAVPFGIVPSR